MKMKELFDRGEFVVSAEVGPPKGIHVDELVEEAKTYLKGVHAVNVTDNQSSVMRLGSLAMCKVLKDAGMDPIFQLACRDRNRIALESDLLSAAMFGIENILCLTGDHTKMGDHPQAKPVFDLDSVSLLHTVKLLESGVDLGGNELVGEPPKFSKVEQIFFLICGFGLPAQYGDTFMGELKSKHERLKETPGQRIVLAGGSGVAFDCDSEMIDEIFPSYEVVNFGMYAGLGTKAVMDLSEAYIREGDIVILSPEQSEQTLSDYFNGEYMWQAADGAFGMLRHIKSENFEVMLGNFPGFALEKLNYVWKGKNPPTDSVYQKKSFNTYGDIDLDTCQKNILPGGYDVNQKVRFTEDVVQPEFLEYMNAWAERLEKKGAAVWYRYCPVNELAVEDADDLKSYDVFLRQKLDFPVIGNPKNSLMEAEWFFDTNFHLNQAGKEVNTVQLIRDIKAMLGDDRTVNVELPEKPHRTWEDISTETRIWTARDSEAYQGEETIVIPENVTQIGDYAFSGCTGLKAIVLEQKDPSKCIVGQHLLDGTSAEILVPQMSADSYKRNYFWSTYAGQIRENTDHAEK